MNSLTAIKAQLQQSVSVSKEKHSVFYKTGAGDYAEHDQFMGIKVPKLRQIAKTFPNLTFEELQILLESPFNEERLLALFLLVSQYKKAENQAKEDIFQFYLKNLRHINNWNLVDASAHLIIGAHLLNADRELLLRLAKSEILWERRIAIVSTWYFIRNNDLEYTFKLAKFLLNDKQDLIHKAVGWMLREAGQKDQSQLVVFLNQYASQMPRTMLRYAIEKFPETERKTYLTRK